MICDFRKIIDWGAPDLKPEQFVQKIEAASRVRTICRLPIAARVFTLIHRYKDEWGPCHVPYLQRICFQIELLRPSFDGEKEQIQKYVLEIKKVWEKAKCTTHPELLFNSLNIPTDVWDLIMDYCGDKQSVINTCRLVAAGLLNKANVEIPITDIHLWAFMIQGFAEDHILVPIALEILISNVNVLAQSNLYESYFKKITSPIREFYQKKAVELRVSGIYVPPFCSMSNFSKSKALSIKTSKAEDSVKPADPLHRLFSHPDDTFIEQKLGSYASIEHYHADCSKLVKESSFKYLVGRFKVLRMSNCHHLTDEVFKVVNPNLIALEVKRAPNLTSEFLVNLSRNFPNLKVLGLDFLSGKVFEKFSEISMPNLEFFQSDTHTNLHFDEKKFPRFDRNGKSFDLRNNLTLMKRIHSPKLE